MTACKKQLFHQFLFEIQPILETDGAWKKFRELSGVLVGKPGFSWKQRGKIISVVLLYCCETWKLTVADEARLRVVERYMTRMCGVTLIDRVLTDVLRDRVGVAVKTEDMIIQSSLQWYIHVSDVPRQ